MRVNFEQDHIFNRAITQDRLSQFFQVTLFAKGRKIVGIISGNIEMPTQHFRIISLEAKQRWESLHFDELRLERPALRLAYAKIKCDEMGVSIFVRHAFTLWYRSFSEFFEFRTDNKIDD